MKSIIRAENLGKKYVIRHEHPERYVALRDVLTNRAKKLFSFPKNLRPEPATVDFEEFWALKDLNFDIQPGDRVGIIGRNGAGKSTLLKILSRITEPSTGRVELNGRVASLLEVGTGFHPELTGRENIFLNGAILGMSRAEIRRKFDEIVDFSGVEKFLDTPVKRYSSGMYVRLAFAVAAHLEPEILVVDEVLAVGDAEFQKKCLGKMEEVSSKEGRTILFVSHNLAAITKICSRSAFLHHGALIFIGEVNQTINLYNSLGRENQDANRVFNLESKTSVIKPKFQIIRLENDKIKYGENLEFQINVITPFNDTVGIELEIRDQNNYPIIYASNAPMQGKLLEVKANNQNEFHLSLQNICLAAGNYSVKFWLIKPWSESYHVPDKEFRFEVETADPYHSGFNYLQSYSRGFTTIHLEINKQQKTSQE